MQSTELHSRSDNTVASLGPVRSHVTEGKLGSVEKAPDTYLDGLKTCMTLQKSSCIMWEWGSYQ
jgi:hypothetical protein